MIKKPVLSPVKNYITPLTSIIQHDKIAVNRVSESLQVRGYAFIQLPNDLIKQIDSCLIAIESFFSNHVEYKKKFFKAPIFGYFSVSHKESFRMLTGSRLQEHKFPQNFNEVKNLVHTIDQLMYSLTLSLSPSLFPKLLESTKKLDIPFFEMGKSWGAWGMFDIAKYHNDGKRKSINCAEHYDPGLLSMSLRSTEPGLELKDEFGKWIKAPANKNIAVLWAGKAASDINPKIKLGIHRVVNPLVFGKPRIAIWHEICTAAQEHKELLKKKPNTSISKSIKFEDSTGIPMSKSISPSITRTSKHSPEKFEDVTGIPMSKSAPPSEMMRMKMESDNFHKKRYLRPIFFDSLLK